MLYESVQKVERQGKDWRGGLQMVGEANVPK